MLSTLLLLGGLLSVSAFFGMVEIATLSLSEGKVRTMVREKLTGARLVERLKAKPRRFLITMLIGNNVINVFAAAVATELALSLFGSNGVAIATGLVTFFILAFGEVLPKTFGQAYAPYVSRYASPITFVIVLVLSPLAWFFEQFVRLFSFGRSQPAREQAMQAAEEIQSLFQIGVEKGAIKKYEQDIASRLFRFNDLHAEAVMRPLGSVVKLEGHLTIETALVDAALSGYSRFPVFDQTVDRILGIVHIKDIVRAYTEGKKAEALASVVKPPAIVRVGQKLGSVFTLMRQEHMPYALVYDDQNQLVGIVTLENVLEQLVGKLYDESDARKV